MDCLEENDLFTNVIGQNRVKKHLLFNIRNYQRTKVMPNMLLVAPKGQGKSYLAKEIAKGLVLYEGDSVVLDKGKPKRKTFIEINCASLKNLKQFVSRVIVPHVQDKDVTLFLDEASELPHDITMALLTILNPNSANRTSYSFEDFTCDFDFKRQTFLFASSESHKIFHALTDRLEKVVLQDYTKEDLASILQIHSPSIKYDPNTLMKIASVLRGNARSAQRMANKIISFVGTDGICGETEWEELKEQLNIYPLGLNELEISLLKILMDRPNGISLTALSSKIGMSKESLQKDVELYLLRNNLMRIETAGRMITPEGQIYIKCLEIGCEYPPLTPT